MDVRGISDISYLSHLLQDKPLLLMISGITATIASIFSVSWLDQVISLGAILLLSLLDLLTKFWACKRNGVMITSAEMRTKGLPKLRDYLLLYIAGALTIPLMREPWGYRAVLYSIAMWELWSIAENLYDGGGLPFDIRRLGFFREIRNLSNDPRE